MFVDHNNIINFGDFKQKKDDKKNKATPTNHSDSTYFVMLGNDEIGTTKFRFGGAFVRDFISRITGHTKELKQQVTVSHNILLKKLKGEKNAEEYIKVQLSKQTLIAIVDMLADEFTFDALFDNETLASQAGMVVGVAIFTHYEIDELEDMLDDQWIDCDLDVLETIFDEVRS